LLNNNGVFKTQQGMAQVDRTAQVTATITLPGHQIQSAVEWTTDKQIPVGSPADTVTVQIAPGGIAVMELRVKP